MLPRILQDVIAETLLDSEVKQFLRTQILAEPQRSQAFNLTVDTVDAAIEKQIDLLRQAYPVFEPLCQQLFPNQPAPLEILWNLWLPLALHLADQRRAQTCPLIQGVLGGQGSGKTTLGIVLTLLLQQLGYNLVSVSLDDLYKTHAERLQLRANDPRLIWRGPPGTHDIDLGIQLLDRLRQAQSGTVIEIPRFDKSLHQGSGDRIAPDLVTDIDIVLFEGWFVGVRPINPVVFNTAPPPILTEDDRSFARDMNAQLHHYLPLWEQLDSLIVLYPVDYRLSKQWRQQAEQQMRAGGKPGMSDADIEAFVDYFWKALHPELLIKPLVETPDLAEFVIEIQPDHTPGRVYRSGHHLL